MKPALVRVARRDYDQAAKVPPQFLGEVYGHIALAYQAWTEARPANDFAKVRRCWKKRWITRAGWPNFFPGYEHMSTR